MKNISRYDNRLCMQIIKLVSFCVKWVANENTRGGSWIKFSTVPRYSGNVSKAIKNSKVIIRWRNKI